MYAHSGRSAIRDSLAKHRSSHLTEHAESRQYRRSAGSTQSITRANDLEASSLCPSIRASRPRLAAAAVTNRPRYDRLRPVRRPEVAPSVTTITSSARSVGGVNNRYAQPGCAIKDDEDLLDSFKQPENPPGTCASCGSSTKIHTGAPQLLNPCYCLSDESDRDEGNSVRMMKAKKVNWGGATTTNAGGKVTSVNPGLAAESSENSNTSCMSSNTSLIPHSFSVGEIWKIHTNLKSSNLPQRFPAAKGSSRKTLIAVAPGQQMLLQREQRPGGYGHFKRDAQAGRWSLKRCCRRFGVTKTTGIRVHRPQGFSGQFADEEACDSSFWQPESTVRTRSGSDRQERIRLDRGNVPGHDPRRQILRRPDACSILVELAHHRLPARRQIQLPDHARSRPDASVLWKDRPISPPTNRGTTSKQQSPVGQRDPIYRQPELPVTVPLCTRTSVSEQAAKENHRGSATINLPSRTTPCWKLQAGRGGRSERSKQFDSKLVDTYFDDVGGMAKILREFLLHVKHPECRLRVDLCSGQTLLSHAIAGQLKIGLATKLVAELARRKSKAVTRCSSSVPPTGRMRLNRPCVASVALTRKSRSEFRSAKRAQILKIICKNLKFEQTMDYDENANLAPGYVAAVTTAIKRMLPERERQQLLVERRKTDQDRLKQLAKKVVIDDKVSDGIGEPASVHSCTSVTAELRSNPSLSARTRVPELAVEDYTVLRAQAKGATRLVAGVSGKSEQRIQDIQEVFNQAAVLSPCLLFFDDINAISANRVTAQKDMERRIVAQLLCSLDGLCESKKVTRCSSPVLPTGGMRSTRPCVAPLLVEAIREPYLEILHRKALQELLKQLVTKVVDDDEVMEGRNQSRVCSTDDDVITLDDDVEVVVNLTKRKKNLPKQRRQPRKRRRQSGVKLIIMKNIFC
ncbi:peroxisome assembly factor-2 [Culex quinquefasciatus]|uniref:Peroxisome assembly factor-2 n=1 Tax=Culex quinquefasciatus TaxID=7176 RepID=B0XF82_CULQU|nr:peroxisome assembly factor-2 [Culex quinquefasciatus]|eukprot:XP_001868304.1 peroxisome assembly factor-2 [Culex quinquefasciatus]